MLNGQPCSLYDKTTPFSVPEKVKDRLAIASDWAAGLKATGPDGGVEIDLNSKTPDVTLTVWTKSEGSGFEKHLKVGAPLSYLAKDGSGYMTHWTDDNQLMVRDYADKNTRIIQNVEGCLLKDWVPAAGQTVDWNYTTDGNPPSGG